MKKFAIITACDSKYGNFLVNHWLKSLLMNIDRNLVDIVVLDYGLTNEQKERLLSKEVIVIKCNRDGHVVNIRFRDLRKFLEKNKYEQIISCDSGDIIFQKDITHLFFKNKNDFRIVAEELKDPFMKQILRRNLFSKHLKKEIIQILNNKKSLNAGFIVAPTDKFILLCKFIEDNLINKKVFGPDQFLVNIYFYRHGFFEIGSDYNFIITIFNRKFKIKNGMFLSNGKIIPIVHNAGDFFRCIKNFGYGKGHNKVKPVHYFIVKNTRKLFTYFFSVRKD